MTTANTKFASMGKEELRAACRVASISYSKLNNEGMRVALVMHAKEDAADDAEIAAWNAGAATPEAPEGDVEVEPVAAAPAKKEHSGFKKGSGCYTCGCCGKLTRALPNGDAAGCNLCVNCFGLASWDNTLSDTGELPNYAVRECLECFADLTKEGASPADLFPAMAAYLIANPTGVVSETEPAPVANPFGAMFGAVVPPTTCGTATKVVDGKKVTSDVKPTKASAPRAPAAPKVPAPVLPKVIHKGYKIQKDREERNGVKKPSIGGLCFAVWAALDAKPGVKASDLQAIADANQWNRNNVLCEFYNWRRFNGVTGRAK